MPRRRTLRYHDIVLPQAEFDGYGAGFGNVEAVARQVGRGELQSVAADTHFHLQTSQSPGVAHRVDERLLLTRGHSMVETLPDP